MNEENAAAYSGVGALEHQTGPSRGRTTWLSAASTDIALTPQRFVHCAETKSGHAPDNLIARFRRVGDTYELIAAANAKVWVNGTPVASKRLVSGDMIELGEDGPLSRFRLFREDRPVRETIPEILADTVAYLRVSRQPLPRRLLRATTTLARRLTHETTWAFRGVVLLALLALAVFTHRQVETSRELQAQLDTGRERLEDFASALMQTRSEALTPADLDALGERIGSRIASNAERLAALEDLSTAGARVIADAAPSVAFVQGAYAFRQTGSGRPLRHFLGGDGLPRYGPGGQPRLTLDGDGPVAELQYTGTGFLLADARVLVTNRHVALPWEDDPGAEALATQGLEPYLVRLVAYLPGGSVPEAVSLLVAGEDADLALLRADDGAFDGPGLALADDAPAAGSEVIVMGYPTGLRSMLVQSGDAFIAALDESGETDFWQIAERLADENLIHPLASRGIVGQSTPATLIYDAETTHGGSGGPVLDVSGRVVAVNAAILPEYGGSNIGVPVARVRELIREAGAN